MLKIVLKQGESIDIGKNVRVMFNRGSESRTVLVIDAPKEVKITRNPLEKKEKDEICGKRRLYNEKDKRY